MLKTILSVVLGFVNNFFTNMFNTWFQSKEAEKVGKLQQQMATEEEANAKIREVQKVGDAVKPLTADELRSHTKDNDPDFRD